MANKKYIDYPAGTYDTTKIFLQANPSTGALEKINLPSPGLYPGTGAAFTAYASGDLLFSSATNILSKLAAGTTGQILTVASGLPSWANAPVTLPSQTGNSGKFLTTNGTTASWSTLSGWSTSGNSGTTAGTDFLGTTDSQPFSMRVNNIEFLRTFPTTRNIVIQDGGTFTDAGYRLEVKGTGRIDGINIAGSSTYNGNNLVFGGSLGSYPDRSIAIGASVSGSLSTGITKQGTVSAGGTLIGGFQGTCVGGICIGCSSSQNSVNSSYGIAIGYGASSFGTGVAIGNSYVGNTSGNSAGISIQGRIPNGIGNYAIALYGYAGSNYSIAIGGTTSAVSEMVVGAAYDNGDYTEYTIKNIYFGSGKQRYGTAGLTRYTGYGVSYTINGSGAYGNDYAGGNITIAGGKGTGAGSPGDVIFSTATTGASGGTLQTLLAKWYIKGNTGALSNILTPDASAIIQADSTTKGILFPRMTTTQKTAISSPPAGLVIFDTDLGKLCLRTLSAWETITSV